MKKLLACFLALMLALTGAALAEPADAAATPEPVVVTGPIYPADELVVGATTALSGNFFNEMWGNNTSDLDVRMLLHGYNLVQREYETGVFVVDDSVVSGLVVTREDNGDRTYTLELYDDMTYSDGTPITAKDYAFSILLSMAPEMEAIGAATNASNHIVGSDEYKAGTASALAGLRVLSDTQLSLRVKAEYLPFFYELGLLNYTPCPISVIAPGCEVADDGEGAYIRNIDSTVTEPIFTAELLEKTMLDPETGYVSHPSVVSGPYTLTSYDADAHVAEFAINEAYKGNSEGHRPTIARLVYKQAENGDMVDLLSSGEFGLLHKVVNSDTIDSGMQLIAGSDACAMNSYARSGLSFFSFCCEQAGVSSAAVRQAIASCLDKDALVTDYVGVYGLRADGYYGIGQWMVQLLNGTTVIPEGKFTDEDQAKLDEISLDDLKKYDLDLDAANALLDGDGWTLNREGGEYNPETDDVRCKEIDGTLVALDLKLIYPEGNAIADALDETFISNLAQAGIALTAEAKPMTELLRLYYRQQERDCDMIYLATNFSTLFDPSATFDPSDAFQGVNNRTGIADDELYQLAVDMRKTEPANVAEYCQKWMAFQQRFTEVLPMIPVYSNVYFDFYTDTLQDYTVGEDVTWAQAIVGARLSDAMPETDETVIAD